MKQDWLEGVNDVCLRPTHHPMMDPPGNTKPAPRGRWIRALIATALFSTLGMVCGTAIGRKFGQKSKLAAGIVLVIIGIRIILQ